MNRALTIAVVLSVLPVAADSAETPSNVAEGCELCSFPSGWLLETDLGTAFVSDDSFKFGDYTGMTDSGAFLIGSLVADYRRPGGQHWRLAAADLGLDSRAASLNGGLPGRYRLRMSYAQIPHNLFESGQTPFTLSGANFTLPQDWQTAPTSGAMSGLNAALSPVAIRTERESFGLGFSFVQNRALEYDLDYQYTNKTGNDIFGASFLNTATLLPRPVDYAMHTLDAGVSFRASAWSARVAYLGSLF
ncbi:MAG: MtrB/PioB family outer membrane beta-barrel protein, partial [Pseudomonadota bacterium]